MPGMLYIESFSSLFLPAGRQGRWGKSPIFSNGVYGLTFSILGSYFYKKEYLFYLIISIKLFIYFPPNSFFQVEKKVQNRSEVPGGRLRK